MKRLICIIMLTILSIGLLSSCGVKDSSKSGFTIAVSIPPEAELVRKVCGDKAEILTVIPAGYSPETYEPTPKELTQLSKADIYFTIGVPAESSSILPKASDIKAYSLNEKTAEKYPELKIDEERDPHIWLSPKRAALMVSLIADKLGELDAENKELYSENAANYIDEINETKDKINTILEGVQNKSFIAFHPAYGYFADEFGLTMYAIEDGGKEATASHLAEMVDFAKANGIKTVFYQQEVDSAQAKAFAEEIGGMVKMLSPLAENYTENLLYMANTIKEASDN